MVKETIVQWKFRKMTRKKSNTTRISRVNLKSTGHKMPWLNNDMRMSSSRKYRISSFLEDDEILVRKNKMGSCDEEEKELLMRMGSPGMRRRSDVSFRSHIGRDVADHAETSS